LPCVTARLRSSTMLKRWLSKSDPTSSESTSEWVDREQSSRRADYLAECRRISSIWEQNIAAPDGLLPGATLDPFITPRGWCGHVQATIEQTGDLDQAGRRRLAAVLADLYGLPQGAVLVDDGWEGIGDTAFIWAYRRPGEVDYHQRLPHSVFRLGFAGEAPLPGQLTKLERSELKSWTRKHVAMLESLRGGRHVEMVQMSRRYNRMRGAILDALTRAAPEEVRDLLVEVKVHPRDLGDDIARVLGMSDRGGGITS
jgi:hypothetical protein